MSATSIQTGSAQLVEGSTAPVGYSHTKTLKTRRAAETPTNSSPFLTDSIKAAAGPQHKAMAQGVLI